MRWLSLLVLCALILIFVSAMPAKKVLSKDKTKSPRKNTHSTTLAVKSEMDAFKYLTRFGYNPCESSSDSNSSDLNRPSCQSSLETMLKQFQTNFHLPVTKKLDAATVRQMNKPRCSLPDTPPSFMDKSKLW